MTVRQASTAPSIASARPRPVRFAHAGHSPRVSRVRSTPRAIIRTPKRACRTGHRLTVQLTAAVSVPAGVLLTVGERHLPEGGSRPGVSGHGRRQRPGHLGLAWRLAELDSHFGLAAGLYAGAVADLAVQAGQELPAHGATLVRQVQPSTAATTGNRLAPSLPATWASSSTTAAAGPRRCSWARNRITPMRLSSLTGSATQAQDARSAKPRPHADELRRAPDAV